MVHQLPTLSILRSSDTEIGTEISFSCYAVDFSPKDYTITWWRNDEKLDQAQINTYAEGKKNASATFYNAASHITVEENLWKDDGSVIKCMFANKEQSKNTSLTYTSGCACE